MTVTVACDGSALRNPGPGGWAWYNLDGTWAAGSPGGRTTNNAMELTAIADALESHPGCHMVIVADSRYAIDCCSKWIHGWRRRGWKTSSGGDVKNRDLIERIHSAMAGRQVVFEWVRGHSGHPGNETADKLARQAAERGIQHRRTGNNT